MVSKLLGSLVIAVSVSFVPIEVVSAQSAGPNLRQYRRQKNNRGIDDGMIKRAPITGDERMPRKAPEHIDDGRFFPRRVFKTYQRAAKPRIEKR